MPGIILPRIWGFSLSHASADLKEGKSRIEPHMVERLLEMQPGEAIMCTEGLFQV
jgi:hypothetical protein